MKAPRRSHLGSLGILLAALAALTCSLQLNEAGLAASAVARFQRAPAEPGPRGAEPVPADPPSYLPWYPSPSPLPTESAYVGVGGAWGAGNIYNTATNVFSMTTSQVSGKHMLDTGLCYFVCYGGPGVPSHHFLFYGNDVGSGHSQETATHHGAADDCNLPGLLFCPGAISNSVFGLTVDLASPPRGDYYFMTLDGNGNAGIVGSLYDATAVIAGAGLGTPAPIPAAATGSLVSYTGTSTSPNTGDVLLGSSTSYVKCDYGETAGGVLTCNQPFAASTGLRTNCLATVSATGCELLTSGGTQSLFVGESVSNYNQGGFLFDGPQDIDLAAGAYATSSGGVGICCKATQTQAAILQVTNDGTGINVFYNTGLTVGSGFVPSRVAGVNDSGTFWTGGGVEPDSSSAGGSGGYAPEAFPIGQAEQHPQMLSGTCSLTSPSTSCTFPSSFEFADLSYNCSVSAQGSTPASDSYSKTSTTSITIYSATSATFSYICMR